jgi:hypothetical protein
MKLFATTTKHELTHPVLKDEAGNPLSTGLVLEIQPADHDDVVTAATEVLKDLEKATHTAESALKNRLKVLESIVVGWEVKAEHDEDWLPIFKDLGFESTEFTKEKLHALLGMKTARWVRNQIDSIFVDAERFFVKASNS